MIVAQVTFRRTQPLDSETARSIIENSVPEWQTTPGLIRKYYIASEDGREVGGVYLWESREPADDVYTDAWRERMAELFEASPGVTYWECHAVLDNRFDELVTPEHAHSRIAWIESPPTGAADHRT